MSFGTWSENTGKLHSGKGKLEIRDNLEYPVCLEVKRWISNPNCDHTMCIDCFKRCYYDSDNNHPRCPICRMGNR